MKVIFFYFIMVKVVIALLLVICLVNHGLGLPVKVKKPEPEPEVHEEHGKVEETGDSPTQNLENVIEYERYKVALKVKVVVD